MSLYWYKSLKNTKKITYLTIFKNQTLSGWQAGTDKLKHMFNKDLFAGQNDGPFPVLTLPSDAFLTIVIT